MNVSKMLSLEGKVALVTGGSRGIGRACALIFADAGADVVITSRHLPDLEKVAGEIRSKGRKALPVASDIGKIADSKKLIERVKTEFGRIDVLMNNAAVTPYQFGPLIDTEEEVWDLQLNVNLKGAFFLSQFAARMMREQGGGSIISVASTQAFRPAHPIYAVTKAAIVMLTKGMAKEWGPYQIRANAIAPGGVDTEFVKEMWTNRSKETAGENSPLGRFGVPDDMAGPVLFLASDASRHITGETIIVDAGGSVGPPPAARK